MRTLPDSARLPSAAGALARTSQPPSDSAPAMEPNGAAAMRERTLFCRADSPVSREAWLDLAIDALGGRHA